MKERERERKKEREKERGCNEFFVPFHSRVNIHSSKGMNQMNVMFTESKA